MKKLNIIAALLLCTLGLYAQNQGERPERPEPPKMKSPAELAQAQVDEMNAEVGLDKKQYKKVYRLLKADFQYRQDAMQQRMGGGMPPQGGPGMGGPGGGMGGPGMGGPGGGMPGGGFGGGMPGGGMPPSGDMQNGERPQGGPGMGPGDDVITEEYLEKQDQKLKKILTAEQYTKWRAKHPAEHMQMPPMELKQEQN